jgi:hypothetical protein
MAKGKGGFIGQDGLNAPDSPTGVSGSAGIGSATVSFTAPSDVGGSAITGYVATSNDGIGTSGSSSPITVTGLTNGTAYTFNVWAYNAFGYSVPSDASGSVTPLSDFSRLLRFGGRLAIAGNEIVDIRFVNIASLGNEADFGDLTQGRSHFGALSNATRSVAGGGFAGSFVKTMDYVNPASAGDATDFGDLTVNKWLSAGLANDTRGVFAGAGGSSNVIEYITIANTGNATDFGDLTVGREIMNSGTSNTTRGVFFGGNT